MNEIVGSVRQVADIVSDIANATEEQSTGIEQVNQAITQMDQVTQQNAALVEEAAAAAQSLEDQAGKLVHLVSEFKISHGAGKVQAPAASVPISSPARLKPRAKVALPQGAAPAPVRTRVAATRQQAQDEDWTEF